MNRQERMNRYEMMPAKTRSAGEWEAFTVKRGKANLVKVKVGLTNDKEAEIIEGIGLDQTVIVVPPASLTNGTNVKRG